MATPIRISYLLKYLKPYAVELDKTIFKKWERKIISTEECIRYFRKHNDVDERMPILKDEFEIWLNGLGYLRNEKK